MSEAQKSKAKSSKNWPVLIAAGLCVVFIVGVWVNNYRVSQAATVAAAAAASHIK
jgi:sensor domain CHASE-containing protein